MATTIDQTQVNGTLLTWGNQTLLWSDALVGLRSWEAPYDTIAYTTEVSETLNFVEAPSKRPEKSFSESFGIVESQKKTIGMNPEEFMGLSESLAKTLQQRLEESLIVGSGIGSTVGLNKSELLVLDEDLGNYVGLSKSETITFAENINRSVGWIRNFAETFVVAEAIVKRCNVDFFESLRVVDAWRRAADMVISDIIIGTTDMTAEDFADFLAYGSSPAYTDWRDFVPGDYEYQEAMFRAVIESKNSDRGLLTGFEVAVDVPDLIDRGSATIVDANAGITIVFSRTFHLVPEITLSTKGGVSGTTLTPELVSATKTSCVVKMKNQNGVYSTGSFTWAAHGY